VDLSVRLAAWRRSKGLTQAALATAVTDLGAPVTGSAVSYWEAGITTPTHANLELVVRALGLTMARFYGRIPRAKKVAA